MVAVLDEVQLTDAVDVDGRHGLALALRGVDSLPAWAHSARGGTEAAVELAVAVDGSDDRVQRDRLQAQVSLAPAAQSAHHFLEGQDDGQVALAAQAGRDLRQRAPAPRAPEVELGVGLRQTGVTRRTPP
jgi:hypothetical protein